MRVPVESFIAINDLSQTPDGSSVTPANLSRQKLPIAAAGLIRHDVLTALGRKPARHFVAGISVHAGIAAPFPIKHDGGSR